MSDGLLVLDLDPTAAPATAIALEETLLAAVADGREKAVLRIWECAEAIALPRYRLRALKGDRGRRPLCGRRSGGSAVCLGPGVLCVSLIVPIVDGEPTIEAAYRLWLEGLDEALSAYEVAVNPGAVSGAFCDGAFNGVVDGRKLAGTAQRRRGRAALVHGCLLVDVDREEYCTALAELGVEARPGRVTTLREEAGHEIDGAELVRRIVAGFASSAARRFLTR